MFAMGINQPFKGLGYWVKTSYQAIGRNALVVAQCLLASRPIDTADAQIAAIALKAQLGLITLSTKDFEGINDLPIIYSWLSHLFPLGGTKVIRKSTYGLFR